MAAVAAGCVNDATEPVDFSRRFDHTSPPAPPTVIGVNNYEVTYGHTTFDTRYQDFAALFNGGLAYGTSAENVHVVNLSNGDLDVVETGLPIMVSTPGQGADHYTVTVLSEQPSDTYGPKSPVGLVTVRETFAWSSAPDDDYVIVKYSLTNTNATAITGLRVGYMADTDLDKPGVTAYNQNVAAFDLGMQAARITTSGTTVQTGIGLIGRSAGGYRGWRNGGANEVFPQRDPASLAAWWSVLAETDLTNRGPADVRQYLGTQDVSIPAGGTEVVTFVLAAGDNAADLAANLSAARAKEAVLGGARPAARADVSIHAGTSLWFARLTFASSAEAARFDAANTRCGGAPITQSQVTGNAVDVAFSSIGFDARRTSGDPMHCAGRMTDGKFFAGVDYPTFDDGSLPVTVLTDAVAAPYADFNRSPEFSPDGSKLAFASDRGAGGLFVMDANGDDASAQLVAQGAWLTLPSWHPDGSRIYFADALPCNGGSIGCHIKVVDLATGVVTTLSTNGIDPRISPDGSSIVFRRGGGLWIMDSSGANARALVNLPGTSNLYPEWSADGSRIYFTRIASGSEGVFTVDVNGANEQRITEPEPGFFRYSTITQDSKSLFFVGYNGSNLIQHDMQSGLHTVLFLSPSVSIPNIPSAQNVDVSPDGKTVVFLGSGGHIYSFQVAAGGTPAERAEAIAASVADLVADGLLPATEGAQLEGMLTQVANKVASGELNAAVNNVGAFINKVNALVRSRRLGEIPGAQLTAEANQLIQTIQSYGN